MPTFKKNQNGGQIHETLSINIGPFGPPKKRVTAIADIVMTFMNSARKKRAKRSALYSVWNPPTNSCSASTKSKGARLTSATAAIKNIPNATN